MLKSGNFFEVADREFDHSVAAMELIELDGGAVEIGVELEVTPVGPRLRLLLVGQAGAAHDQPTCHALLAGARGVVALGDLGLAVIGVDD